MLQSSSHKSWVDYHTRRSFAVRLQKTLQQDDPLCTSSSLKCILNCHLDCWHWCLVLATVARCDNEHMWVSFSAGFSHKVLDASILKTTISYLKVLALPVFHSCMGCDTILLFKSFGKKDSLATVELTWWCHWIFFRP